MQVKPNPFLLQTLRAGLALLLLGSSSTVAFGAPIFALSFPGPAEATASRREPMSSFRIPVGPFSQGAIATTLAEGAIDQSAFRIAAPDLSTLQLLQPLRSQIADAGFTLIYECETEACGGFDFRYGTVLLPEPDMHIDLGDFRYLAARRAGLHGPEYISLIVSKSQQNGFVQMTRVGPFALPAPTFTASTKTPGAPAGQQQSLSLPSTPAQPPVAGTENASANLGERLDDGLSITLEDLVFASGSSDLAEGDYASLKDLAGWLQAHPDRTVTLVGHTDAMGSLASNIALSKLRAASVRQYLLTGFDLPASRIGAEGIGYLAPRDSNLTDAGRQRNRRVEVMLTSTR